MVLKKIIFCLFWNKFFTCLRGLKSQANIFVRVINSGNIKSNAEVKNAVAETNFHTVGFIEDSFGNQEETKENRRVIRREKIKIINKRE